MTKRWTFTMTTVIAVLLAGFGLVHSQNEPGGLAANDWRAVFRISDGIVVGSSRLHRNDGGANVRVQTTDLTEGHAYTLWWVVFNNPEYCVDGCNGDDFEANGGDPRVEASQLYASGNVVTGIGSVGFGAHLAVGDTSGAEFGPGLLDPMGAEIHVVVRTHGAVLPGEVAAQTLTLSGGCNPECTNLQAALHLP